MFYPLSFRIARFPITENTFETVVTNLDADDFPPSELKKLYAMRWGIETSFRELKYTVGLQHFHAKKVEALLAKHISPIRPGRSRPRKLKTKQPFGFLYRVA